MLGDHANHTDALDALAKKGGRKAAKQNILRDFHGWSDAQLRSMDDLDLGDLANAAEDHGMPELAERVDRILNAPKPKPKAKAKPKAKTAKQKADDAEREYAKAHAKAKGPERTPEQIAQVRRLAPIKGAGGFRVTDQDDGSVRIDSERRGTFIIDRQGSVTKKPTPAELKQRRDQQAFGPKGAPKGPLGPTAKALARPVPNTNKGLRDASDEDLKAWHGAQRGTLSGNQEDRVAREMQRRGLTGKPTSAGPLPPGHKVVSTKPGEGIQPGRLKRGNVVSVHGKKGEYLVIRRWWTSGHGERIKVAPRDAENRLASRPLARKQGEHHEPPGTIEVPIGHVRSVRVRSR